MKPVRRARGGAQQLGGGRTEVGGTAELRGVTAGGGRLHRVRQLLVELLPGLVDLGKNGGALKPSPQELRGWDGGT